MGMNNSFSKLFSAIESVVGSENVTDSPAHEVDGLKPLVLALPRSAREVAECLRICSSVRAAVIPAGSMSWLENGNPVRRADVVLSLREMCRVVDYSPADLTATVEAGLTLAKLNHLTKRERQWLPLDPPGGSVGSLGAIAACGSSGALRLGFGTPRDYVIGLKLGHADGSESKCGGRVVKNVAGYDMNKLYVGSYGTLAVITELTFKLRPLAERDSTIVIRARNKNLLFDLANRVLRSELQPASVVLTRQLSATISESSLSGDALLMRFIDNEEAVNHQVGWVTREAASDFEVTSLTDDGCEQVWNQVNEIDTAAANAVRISVRVSGVKPILATLCNGDCSVAADLGTGIIRIAFHEAEKGIAARIRQLRVQCVELGGSLFIERACLAVRREVDAWGDPGPISGLMRSIKVKFDPESTLNPGRFLAGI